ncbi:unnamed protein product [Lota lota]
MGQQELHFALGNILFLLLVLPMSGRAQEKPLCSCPDGSVTENNEVGIVVTTIQKLNPGVTTAFLDPPADNPFIIVGDHIIVNRRLDYEFFIDTRVIVHVVNVNDEPPTFPNNLYSLNVKEFTLVDTVVGIYEATDKDSTQLYYNLIPEPDVGFGLQAPTNARIVVKSILDYDVIKSVKLTLYARDTADPSPEGVPSFTASTTIMVTITDDDNRSPWFQPCSVISVGPSKICQSYGYTGSVSLTEQQVGALTLEPGPLYAVDGDTGINEIITYSILSGNPDSLFLIDANSGNITMTRATDVPGPIVLSVMAAQTINTFQFATTTVTIQVVAKSLHPPVFERDAYSGLVSGLGSMVLNQHDNTPLIIRATDEDYSGGVNPDIVYAIIGSSNFSLIGFQLFLTKDSPLGAVSLQVEARDTAIGDVTRAEVKVEVTSGLPTTSLAPATSSAPQTNGTAVPDTSSTMTTIPTSSPSGSTIDSIATDASMTTQGSVSTDSTTPSHTGGAGTYSTSDMAALGATLAVLLFISLGIIGYLVYRVHNGKAAWGKLSEASVFRSALGGGPKDGVQYTNEAFKNDDDSDSSGPAGPVELRRKMSAEPAAATATAAEDTAFRSAATLLATLPDEEGSATETDGADSEKEVKPILTKERRTEEGYKSVWFKEDIVPDAKEDVHIIPDNGEQDAEEDDDASSSSGNDEDLMPRRKVLFGDADVDSGLGVRVSDSASDSEKNDTVTSDL